LITATELFQLHEHIRLLTAELKLAQLELRQKQAEIKALEHALEAAMHVIDTLKPAGRKKGETPTAKTDS
jgi:hypothetical protein